MNDIESNSSNLFKVRVLILLSSYRGTLNQMIRKLLGLKVEVKYLRGAFFGGADHIYETRFSMPLEPSFGTMPLSSAPSQLHILCAAQLLPTAWTIHLRCAH